MAAKKSTNRQAKKESVKDSQLDESKKNDTTMKKNEPAKSYKELIVEALIALGDRKGSSRPAIKKYIKEKYPSVGSAGGFDSYFNNAIKKGIELKEFELPKGPSGTLKLNKKNEDTDGKRKVETRGRPRKGDTRESKKNETNPESNEKLGGKSKTDGQKKVEKPQSKPKSKAAPSLTYKEMIVNGILQLNNGKGSSRPALKKFVRDQYKNEIKANSNFDHLFNSALKKGLESGDLHQPKGPSGVVKVIKKKKPDTVIKTA